MTNKFQDVINQATVLTDQTKTTLDTQFTPAPAGISLGRLVDYIEVGKQPRKAFKGESKDPAPQVYLTFELLSPKNIREVEIGGGKKKVADRITIAITLSLHEKAKFKKLFNKMRYGRDSITHMSQMLGDAFKITVVHNEVGEGENKKVYANITDSDGSFLIEAPYLRNEIEGTSQKANVEPAISDLRLFIWNVPTKATWDSIFIDGESTVKDDKGQEVKVSKNKFQNLIQSAVNFPGSPVESFLLGPDALPVDPNKLKSADTVVESTDSEVTPATSSADDIIAQLCI